MDQHEVGIVKEILLELLTPDNTQRKTAEGKLREVKNNSTDKYAAYMIEAIKDTDMKMEARSMACVLLRGDMCPVDHAEQSMWMKLSGETRQYIKEQVINLFKAEQNKTILNKIAELASEIAVSINDSDRNDIWPELFETSKQLIANGSDMQIEAGLNVYTETFRSMCNEIVENDKDLFEMFKRTLEHTNIQIGLCSLQAVSQLLCVVQPKYAKLFLGLLEPMAKLPMRAMEEDDETTLEDAMIEFNAIADAEPKFFKNHFGDLFQIFNQIITKSDTLSSTIRQQPIEFLTTVAERQPSLLLNNEEYLKGMLDTTFKLMIDIDAEIDDTWGDPKDPAQVAEEVDEDPVVFGKEVIDRLCSSVGEDTMLPLVCQLVETTIQNEDDWRYKNAGLSAFSQIAEYVAEIDQIRSMIPTVIDHCKHAHPKVRHSAIHCLGQFATDLKHQFTENFHETVVPALYECMSDEVNRVKAHACGSMSNFFEQASQDIGMNYCEKVLERLLQLSKSESSYCCGNAVSCISSLSESCQSEFGAYYPTVFNEFLPVLQKEVPKEYRKFKGQLVESICICSVCVGMEIFRPYAETLIKALLVVQKNHLGEEGDPQRKYMLAAWQRLCLLMEKEFAPYLPEIMPELFKMASLKPSLKVGDTGDDILQYLQEVNTASGNKGVTVASDELEEKNIGIHMLCVIIDELEEEYAPYVEETSKLFLSLISFDYNSSIRSSVADTFPTMLKAIKASSDQAHTLQYAQTYIQALFEAMKNEQDTDVMQHQVSGIKRCVDVMGEFLDEAQVNKMCEIFFNAIEKSDQRKHLNVQYTQENEQDDDEVDVQNRQFMDEENEMEDDLQLTISEAFGSLFKTHKHHCKELLSNLFTTLLPQYLDDKAPFVKQKFGLYIVVDLVEHLGLEILGEKYEDCFRVIEKYSSSINPICRQAGVYGLGVSAKSGGEYFSKFASSTVELLKKAIDMECGTQEKIEYLHAKDNAISSLAKVMKYQYSAIDLESTFSFFLSHLPVKHDLTEAKEVNDFLADVLQEKPEWVIGPNGEHTKNFIHLLGDNMRKDCMHDETIQKFGKFLKDLSNNSNISPMLTEAYNELTDLKKKRIDKAIEKVHK